MKNLFAALILSSFWAGCAAPQKPVIEMTEQQAARQLSDYQQKAAQRPEDVNALFHLAQAHEAMGADEQAVRELEKIIALDRNFANAYLLKAKIHQKQNDSAVVLATYLKVLALPHGHNYVEQVATEVGMPYAIRPLTVGPGNNVMARFSPDSQQIAWQSDRNGDWDIYLAKADGSAVQAIVFDKGNDEGPAFSPDGQFLAFVSNRHELEPRSLGYEKREIFLYDLTFHKQRRLTKNDIDDWAPVFYPDSSQLIYVSEQDARDDDSFVVRKSRLLTTKVATIEPHYFRKTKAEQTSPAALHDGRLAWIEIDDGIYRILTGTADVQPDTLMSDAHPKGGLSSSQRGESLTFFMKKDDNVDIYLLNLYNKQLLRLTASQSKDIYPSLSPDGKQIVFSSDRFGKLGLYTIDLSTPTSLEELRSRIVEILTNAESSQKTE